MDCLNPIDLKKGFPVPCGKCIACRKKRQREWIIRLTEEVKNASSAVFITLTYDEEHIPKDDQGNKVLCKRDIQLFLKRLRKRLGKQKIRYFICGEFGPNTLRPHYHGILFNLSNNLDYVTDVTLHSWNLGFVRVNSVVPAHIGYVAKYCVSDILLNDPSKRARVHFKPFMMCSTRPGIGSSYLSENMVTYHLETQKPEYTFKGGTKASLPRYYREKIYDDAMKLEMFNVFKEKRKNEYRARQDKYAEDFRRYNRDLGSYLLVRSQETEIEMLDQFNFPKGDLDKKEAENSPLEAFYTYVKDQDNEKLNDYIRRETRRHRESGKL